MSESSGSGRIPRAKGDDLGGRLARVAHELNAPVSLIVGSIQNLERHLDILIRYARETEERFGTDPVLEERFHELGVSYAARNAPRLVAVCDEGVQRLRHVLDQLEHYAGRPLAQPQRERIDIAQAVRQAVRMASQGRSRLPIIEFQLGDLPRVSADREDLGQVLTNLVANALDAVEHRENPRVWISARFDESSGWVELRMRDNGPGIPAANRHVIFEPFFTTKIRSTGLGLGLAIAREMIEAQNGSLSLVETAGEGAEFMIRVPTARG